MHDPYPNVPRSDHVRRHLPADMPEKDKRAAEANYFELIGVLAEVALRLEREREADQDDGG